jgi:hypothetical protein
MNMEHRVAKALDPKEERQQLIEEIVAEYGPDWVEEYKPGSFGCHELLDRTSLVADTVEQYVLSHPACVQNEEWFALAEKGVAALRELYQRIGDAHLNDGGRANNNR